MTKIEIDSFVKTVAERQDTMDGEELDLCRQMVDLEYKVSDIERQMECVRDRIFALHDTFNMCMLPVGGNVLMKEYMEHGFGSGIVKDCVGVVRRMFLDDSDPNFRKMECINICECYLYGHVGVAFVFCDDMNTLTIRLVSSFTAYRGTQFDIEQRANRVGERPLGDVSYMNIVKKDIVGSIEVEYDSDVHSRYCDTVRLPPTRDIQAVKKFVYDAVKRRI